MRKIIASRLLTSKTTIPHFYLHVEVDAAPLLALRKQVNDQAEKTHGNKYSVNDFILKAVINAAQTVPAINASFAGDHIVKFKHVGLSIAVAVEDGLVTPVIKEAETKSLLAISKAVKDFAARAKDKKLKPDEFDGGTITVSNLGAWGIESFDAIVNPPQAAILSVGAAIEKPVVKNGQIVPGTAHEPRPLLRPQGRRWRGRGTVPVGGPQTHRATRPDAPVGPATHIPHQHQVP